MNFPLESSCCWLPNNPGLQGPLQRRWEFMGERERLCDLITLTGEVKTLMIQLLSGVKHLHDNWILHRDLKTSNLLLSHAGILKVSPYSFQASCLGKQSVVWSYRPPCPCYRWATLGWLGSMVHP